MTKKNVTKKSHEMNLWERIIADTPAFFKKLIWIGITIGTVCTSLRAGLPSAGIDLPTWLDRILEIGIAVGIVAIIISKAAVQEPPTNQE